MTNCFKTKSGGRALSAFLYADPIAFVNFAFFAASSLIYFGFGYNVLVARSGNDPKNP